MSRFVPTALGWQRDLPDLRDFLPADVQVLTADLKPMVRRPSKVDWREFYPAVEDQGDLPSSSAHACVGMLQYFTYRASGRRIEPSRLFVYLGARRLSFAGENFASIRNTWKAIIRFGIPPESFFPYQGSAVAVAEPPPFAYSFRDEVTTLKYVRLDDPMQTGDHALATMLNWLAAGFSSALGFPIYSSITREAEIPAPTRYDSPCGGQVVIAVGYDDGRRIRSDKGALLIRGSWGENWGDQGYGWLPYSYVRRRLSADCWTVLSEEWIQSEEFQQPSE